MSETTKIILGICLLIVVYALTRKYHVWRISRAYTFIIEDLKKKGAVDPSTAVELPYTKQVLFRFGTRDYRPKAVEHLLLSNIIGMTEKGDYYLQDKKVGQP